MSISLRSVSSSVLSPPILGAFTIPPPLPARLSLCLYPYLRVSPPTLTTIDVREGSLASAVCVCHGWRSRFGAFLWPVPKDKEPEEPDACKFQSAALSNARA